MEGGRWSSRNLRRLHIELTNHCNAACPVCPRYYRNSTMRNPWMQPDQIGYDEFVRWFPASILGNVNRIAFCGTHGDPAMSPDLVGICRYTLDHTPHATIQVVSNGGTRNEEFWSDLGRLFAGTNSKVVFSIDGLSDTNHIYRRNVIWDRVMSNARAYIGAGGRALWHYLVFRHNQHQIEEARDLASSMGFSQLVTKRALGFDRNGRLQRMRAMGSDGKLQYWIDPPDDHRYLNADANPDGIIIEDPHEFDPTKPEPYAQESDSYDKWLDDVEIDCKSLGPEGAEVYVDCHGMVHPCCWVGEAGNSAHMWSSNVQLKAAIGRHADLLNLRVAGNITNVLDSGVLDLAYSDSWKKPSCADGRMQICAMTCPRQGSAIDRVYQ